MLGRIALLTLLLATLSGCSGGGGGGGKDPVDALDDLDVEATDTTGVIRGVVVDDAIRPLAGVAITVQGAGGPYTAETQDSGTFGFDGLAPGTYLVDAHLLGFDDARQSVEVVAGVDEPPAVKMLLTRQVGFRAFVEQFKWDGYMECGLNLVIACAGPNAGSQITCAASKGEPPIGPPTPPSPVPVCLGNLTNDEFTIWHGVSPGVGYIQSEMVWENTQALGDTLTVYMRYGSLADFNAGFYNGSLNSSTGSSPLTAVVTEDDMEDTDLGIHNGLVIAIFPGESAMLQGLPLGATVSQTWTVFTHAFHGYLPPEGWTFVGTNEVPPPA